MLGLDHPLRIVEQSNMLDVLTGGRCLIVLGDDLDPTQYRRTLTSAGHPESTLDECLRWLPVVVQMTSGAVLPALRSLAVRSA